MKLRWFSIYDKRGKRTKPELQYWDEDTEKWKPIKYVECKVGEYEDYMQSK